jgi:hypothetical protein
MSASALHGFMATFADEVKGSGREMTRNGQVDQTEAEDGPCAIAVVLARQVKARRPLFV